MNIKYFRDNKENIFPDIKDWTKSYDELRNANPNDLTYKEWFYFHPSAYHLFNFGVVSLAILMFGVVTALTWGNSVLRILFLIFVIIYIIKLRAMIIKYPSIKKMNMYDLYMREDMEVETNGRTTKESEL